MNRYKFLTGKYPRPYVDKNGSRYWFKDNKYWPDETKPTVNWGVLHRVDGPALEIDGADYYYLNGTMFTKEQFEKGMKQKEM